MRSHRFKSSKFTGSYSRSKPPSKSKMALLLAASHACPQQSTHEESFNSEAHTRHNLHTMLLLTTPFTSRKKSSRRPYASGAAKSRSLQITATHKPPRRPTKERDHLQGNLEGWSARARVVGTAPLSSTKTLGYEKNTTEKRPPNLPPQPCTALTLLHGENKDPGQWTI